MDLPWTGAKATSTHVQPADTRDKSDQRLLEAVVRAKAWLADLSSGRFSSIEELATGRQVHPKIVRKALRLAFLSPCITTAVLTGDQSANLKFAGIPKILPLDWQAQRQILRGL